MFGSSGINMDSKLFSDLIPESDDYLIDIHTAASIGCDERVRDIIENSEDKGIVNKQNKISWTPLMYAASCINLKVVVLLLEEGASVNLMNDDNHTALILAAKCGSSDLINLLIDKGANVNQKDWRGWTAAFHAAAYGHRNVLQSLIERGASLNELDYMEMTPLMFAASAGNEIIVRDLLYFGADVNIQSKEGDTARSLALQNGYIKIADLLDTKQQSSTVQSKQTDLLDFLSKLQLTKYVPIFESHDIDLNALLQLTEENLKELGIKPIGPRRKLCVAISEYNKRRCENCACSIENKKLLQTIEELQSFIRDEQERKNYIFDCMNQALSYVLFTLERTKEQHLKLKQLGASILLITKKTTEKSNGSEELTVDRLQGLIDLVFFHICEVENKVKDIAENTGRISSENNLIN